MISSLLQSQASRVTPRALNNARATFSRQVGRCQSTLPESSHDEIQKLAKTLNGMLKPFSPNSQAAQCEHPYWRYRNAWTQHPWAYRRRGGGLLKALLLVGIGYGGCKWISEKRDHHREMDMALAKAKATGDFTDLEQQRWQHRGYIWPCNSRENQDWRKQWHQAQQGPPVAEPTISKEDGRKMI